jgi:transcriptional regulator with XRE-family HTH domain
MKALHDVLRRRRERADKTRTELAALAGTSRQQIDNMETGNVSPNVGSLVKYANALGCKAWQLLKDADL